MLRCGCEMASYVPRPEAFITPRGYGISDGIPRFGRKTHEVSLPWQLCKHFARLALS